MIDAHTMPFLLRRLAVVVVDMAVGNRLKAKVGDNYNRRLEHNLSKCTEAQLLLDSSY